MSVEFKIGDDKANNKSLAAERSQQEEENPDENDHHRIKRQQQQRKNPSLKSSAPSVKFHEIVATDTEEDMAALRQVALSATNATHTPIDDSFMPKQLTVVSSSENMARNFSGTYLAKMQEETKSPAVGKTTATADDPAAAAGSRQRSSSTKTSGSQPREYESRVLVLYTGGTIGMQSQDTGHGVYNLRQHYLPSAIRELPPLNDKAYVDKYFSDAKVRPYSLPPVRGMKKRVLYWVVEYEPLLDSSDMTFDDWIRIAKDIRKSYSAYDGFVVLHGTDTLTYTACALSFMMENLGKPVVITGAQIPVAEVRSDGLCRENMIAALIIAGNMDIPEVTVLFNNKLLRGNRATKLDCFGMDAFDSPNMPPLATLDISIKVNYESIFRNGELHPFSVEENLCRNVVVIRIFPSIPIESVRATLRPPTQGVVLQTYGSGNLPSRRTDIIEEIRKAVERGCLVVNVSQCVKGHVEANYANGKILEDAGVIPGSDMTTEAALTKLAYVLAKQDWDLPTKRLMMQRNLAGELTVAHSESLDQLEIIPRLAKFLSITSTAEISLLREALYPPLVCYAGFKNDVQLLESLRLSGANMSAVDYNSRTALHVAAAAGNLDAVEYLLKHGASVHARDACDDNALHCAIQSKNVDVIRVIRKAGGMIVASTARIGVELCLASSANEISTLSAWHEAGANLNTSAYDGKTAFHIASGLGLWEVCEFLREHGGGGAGGATVDAPQAKKEDFAGNEFFSTAADDTGGEEKVA